MQNSRFKIKYIVSKYQFIFLMILSFGFLWIGVTSIINHKIIELNGFEKTIYFWGLLCLGIFVVGEIIIRIIQMLVYRIRYGKCKYDSLKISLYCFFAWCITTTLFLWSFFKYLNVGL
jgi:hypothetical protein